MQYIRGDKIFFHRELLNYVDNKTIVPITIELHLTNRCNIKCHYCIFNDRDKQLELDGMDAIRIINTLRGIGIKGLIFSGGGEPTIHKDFEQIALYAGKYFDIALITNGLEDVSDYVDHFAWTRFSLDSFDRGIYKQIKGVDKFEQAEGNIKKAIANKGQGTVGVQMVVTSLNYEQIFDMYKYVLDLGADYFQFRPLENGKYTDDIWHSVNVEIEKFKAVPFVLTTENKWNEIRGVKKLYEGCKGADFIGAISARGDFHICCHHINKAGSYGNIITDGIDKILNNRMKVQEQLDYSKCPVACRGSNLNLALESFDKIQHRNFL
ncbi:hypothetical protein CMI37_07030 [Candidatus Pacearchaeota archaeon]|nr:hypothetical protein [Candidatus Pacearchaeota archaeon]|tara:strand:- start:2056 stop:3024 length:969 start_codon:yes stop_codon:yes gene_type:complete